MRKDEKILIPDEFVPDYSISKEEQKEQEDKHRKKTKEAFDKLFEKAP